MKRLVQHVQSNLVAYVALFVALGGTSYAAFSVPANSVGRNQIRNHIIDPVKLDPRYIAAYVRAWASVSADGRIVASSGRAGIVASVGADKLTWNTSYAPRCSTTVTVANPTGPGSASAPAFADASLVPDGRRLGALVSVYGMSPSAGVMPARQPYVVAVVCPVPKR